MSSKLEDKFDFLILIVLGILISNVVQMCEEEKALGKEKIRKYEMNYERIYGRAPDVISLPESLSSYYYYDNKTGKILWREDLEEKPAKGKKIKVWKQSWNKGQKK